MPPLQNVRVIDASNFVSGPMAALALGDLGAEVVKVEPPRGDPFRRVGVQHSGVSMTFTACNFAKTSVRIDLGSEEGRGELDSLLKNADILVTNWRPGVDAELGFDPASVRLRHPQLIWVRVSGYGQDGPGSSRPAFDALLQARSGYALARDGQPPALANGWLADKVSAMLAAQAALAALHQRNVTGIGTVVDVAMLDAMAYFNGPDVLAGSLIVGETHPDVMHYINAARPLATADGWIVISPVSGQQLKSLVYAVAHAEWAQTLRAITDPAELIDAMNRLLETVLPARPTAEWESIFAVADVPASAVLSISEHLSDEFVAHNKTYLEFDDPVMGRIRHCRHPARFDSGPGEWPSSSTQI